jgi:hypothetical protein
MAIDVTYQILVDKLREAVANRGGDYVYQPPGPTGECFNWHQDTDTPGCIVGYVFHALGVSGNVLLKHARASSAPLTHALEIEGIIKLPNFEAHRTLILTLLYAVQTAQDTRTCWGEAVNRAITAIADA